MTTPRKQLPMLTIRTAEEDVVLFRAIARLEGVSLAMMMRRLMDFYYEHKLQNHEQYICEVRQALTVIDQLAKDLSPQEQLPQVLQHNAQ